MQMLSLLSSFPPTPTKRDDGRNLQSSLAARFAIALAIIAVAVIGLEIACNEHDQAANRFALLEQES